MSLLDDQLLEAAPSKVHRLTFPLQELGLPDGISPAAACMSGISPRVVGPQ